MKSITHLMFCFLPFWVSAQIDSEPSNSAFAGANAITVGVPNNATIYPEGDFDYFKFTVPRACNIHYKVENVPPAIRLEGQLLHTGDDDWLYNANHWEAPGVGYTWSARACVGGEYRVKFRARDGNASTSAYKFTVTIDTLDQNECNDDLQTSTLLQLGVPASGAIDQDYDIDYYKFMVPRGGILSYTVDNVPFNVRMVGILFDGEEEQVEDSYYYGGYGEGYTYSAKVCTPGWYYLELQPKDFLQGDGVYDVTVNLDTSDVYECNDAFLTASPIACGVPVFASMNTSNDKDYFKFTMPQSGIITANVTNIPYNLDLRVGLYGPEPSTSQVMPSVYGSVGVPSLTLVSPNLQAGTYYIYINDDKSNFSLYQLMVSCGAVATDEAFWEASLKVYPNPAYETLTMEVSSELDLADSRYMIRNMLGKTVLEAAALNPTEAIDVHLFPTGIYLLEVQTGKGSVIRRFVKRG